MNISNYITKIEGYLDEIPKEGRDSGSMHKIVEQIISEMDAIQNEIVTAKDFKELEDSRDSLKEMAVKIIAVLEEGALSSEDQTGLSKKVVELNETMEDSPITNLYKELMWLIFGYTDREDVSSIRSVSTRFRQFAQDPIYIEAKGGYDELLSDIFEKMKSDEWKDDVFKKKYEAELKCVRSLNLRDVNVSADFLNFINDNCPKIEHLSLPQSVTNEDLAFLSSNLTSLELLGCRNITDDGLKEVSKLKNLTWLNLRWCNITNEGLKEVSKLENLTSLNLSWCNITDDGLKDVSKLKTLTSLSLSGCRKITYEGLKEVSKLENLTSLNLALCTKITAEGLKEVSKLKNLTLLDLVGCTEITNEGLKEVSKLENLTWLDLAGCTEITDEGLKEVSKLENLTWLSLWKCNITDEGLKEVSKLKNLTSLHLALCTKITDEYIADFKSHYENIKIRKY